MNGNVNNLYIKQGDILPKKSAHLIAIAKNNASLYGNKQLLVPISETERLHKKAVEEARKFIREHFSRQITIAEIAASVYMSTYHFCRIFKKYTNYAPHQYLLQVRLERAAFLLAHSDRTITYICNLSGFKRASHFSVMFAKRYQISPTIFREEALTKTRQVTALGIIEDDRNARL